MLEPVAPLADGGLVAGHELADRGIPAVRQGPLAKRIRAGLDGLDLVFRALLVIALVIQLVIVLAGIVSRFWFDESLLWADEAAKLFLSLITFVGGALAFRARHHTTVEFLTSRFPPHWRTAVAIGVDLLILVAAVVVGDVSLDLLSISAMSDTPILQINAAWLVLPLSVGLGLTALFAIERLVFVHALKDVVPAAIAVALLVGIVYAVSIMPALHLANGSALGIMLIAFLVAILL
jgi:TRAP-type C4-dicarboxylate transport system permease small subunit